MEIAVWMLVFVAGAAMLTAVVAGLAEKYIKAHSLPPDPVPEYEIEEPRADGGRKRACRAPDRPND